MAKPLIKCEFISRARDGGTTEGKGPDGKHYFVDFRMSSTTKGKVYDGYPGYPNSKMIDVALEIDMRGYTGKIETFNL